MKKLNIGLEISGILNTKSEKFNPLYIKLEIFSSLNTLNSIHIFIISHKEVKKPSLRQINQ